MKNLNSSDETCEHDSNFSHRKETSQRNRQRRPDKQLYVPRAVRVTQKQISTLGNTRKVSKEEKYCNNEDNSLLTVQVPNEKVVGNDGIHQTLENLNTDHIKSIKKLAQSSNSFTSDDSNIECSCSESIKVNKIDKQLYVPPAIRATQKQNSTLENSRKVSKEEEKYCYSEDNSLFTVQVPNEEVVGNLNTDHIKSIKKLAQSSNSFITDASDIECSYSKSMKINKIENAQSQIDEIKFCNDGLEPENIVSANDGFLEEKTVYSNQMNHEKSISSDEKSENLFVFKDYSLYNADDDKYKEHVNDENQRLYLNPTSSVFTPDSESKQCFDVKLCETSIPTNDGAVILDDSWESMFNDEGDCLDPELVRELCKVTGRLKVHEAKNDYKDYQTAPSTVSDNYDHIVELSFPSEFNTQDLVSSLSIFHQESYTIKWVDDCHALVVFTSPALAYQALQLSNQLVRVRPISDGTKESKSKARCLNNYDEPSKPRPTTSTVLARRLVSGALGLKDKTPKEQREKERDMLREAREKKRQKAKQRQDIWDGVIL